jgi:DNA mismatch repair protein MSH5
MAVSVTDRGTVGCAYYVAQTEMLYFMEDLELGGADIVDQREQISRHMHDFD